MTYHTVYKITNRLNGKFYIGCHSTDNLNDGYMGSGLGIKRAIKKYGVDNFSKEILFILDNQSDMLRMEEILVDMILVKQTDTYNAKLGGIGGSMPGRKLSEQTRKKMSDTRLVDNWQRGKPGTNRDKFGVLHYLSKSIAQVDKNTGLIVEIYASIREAERETGIPNTNISACCMGKKNHQTAGGYKWKYFNPWRGY